MVIARFGICTCAVALMLLCFGGTATPAAVDCPPITYSEERSKLRDLLVSNGYARDERTFLLRGADLRVGELQRAQLNERGAGCGIRNVRAYVMGCMNKVLPSTLGSVTSPDGKTDVTLWGKARISKREAAFIGIFHACRGTAMKHFFRSGELE